MKKNSRQTLLPIIMIVVCPFGLVAQGKLMSSSDPAVRGMEANRKTGSPFSVLFGDNAGLRMADSKAVFVKYLGLRTGLDELRPTITNETAGVVVQRYQQYFSGIKVEHGAYSITIKEGQISFMTGDFYNIDVSTLVKPVTSERQALENAWVYMDGVVPEDGLKQAGELVFVENGLQKSELDGKLHLAYKFLIDSRKRALNIAWVYVDATTGAILFTDSRVKAGCFSVNPSATNQQPEATAFLAAPDVIAPTANTRYSGNVTNMVTRQVGATFRLEALLASENYPNHTRNLNHQAVNTFTTIAQFNNGIAASTEITDADNSWTAAEYNNANRDNTAFDVHWGTQRVYEYWRIVHNRNSWDGANGVLNCFVHGGVNWDGAFWLGDGGINSIFYGDGSNAAGGYTTLTSLDVTAHEIGHGVCQATSTLAYNRESGAMNEGFSDIWGAAIERFGDPHEVDGVAKNYFLIGEEIKVGGGALRSMSYPNQYGQPDTYLGTNWVNATAGACPAPEGGNDFCGVHTNSGVLNYWFYLLVNGGSGTNDLGNAFSVTGIGWTDAERITFLGEVNLTATANYAACRTAMINAATILFGGCSPQTQAVTRAWFAVGVGADWSAPYAIVGNPVVCSTSDYSIPGLPGGASVVWSTGVGSGTVLQLAPNTPAPNQVRISNQRWYTVSTALIATISNPAACASKPISNDNDNSSTTTFQYYQEPCLFYNVSHPAMSGTVSTGAANFVHQGCMVYVNVTGYADVTFTGASQPMFWAVGQTSYYTKTLYFQLPIGSGGIPYTFKISKGVGACYERNLLFFSFSNNGRFAFAAAPNPAKDVLTVTAKENEDAITVKGLPAAKDNLQFTMNVFDANSNRLMLTQKSNKGSVIERLNISTLKQGYYVLQVKESDQVQTMKFFKE